MENDVVSVLRAALGDAVTDDSVLLTSMREDRSGHVAAGPPIAVVAARSIQDVQAAMRIASRFSVPVVTRGAGTGLAGGAIAGTGEIVLSTLAMNRIIEINPSDELAVIEPGIINGDFNDALAEYGMWFAPDPASRAISTIGGNIATNAGGLLCAKYGVTREAILGLKVVLADGRLLTLGHRSVKGVTGLDLTALMIGSEGLLGVIVEATVRIRPRVAGAVATIGAWFPTVVEAAAASEAITASGVQPAVMELMDAAATAAVGDHLNLDVGPRGASYLLVQTDGAAAEVEGGHALATITEFGGDAELTMDPVAGERLLAIRRAVNPALDVLGTVLIEDVAVPRSKLSQMFAAIVGIETKYGLIIPTIAHAGDGNLHPNFIFEGTTVPDTIWAAAGELFEIALELGGTLTGEHGVGLLKRRWLVSELGEDQVELQRQIKAVFDPHGLLNPGKVL